MIKVSPNDEPNFKVGVTRKKSSQAEVEKIKASEVKVVPKGFDYDAHYESIFGQKLPAYLKKQFEEQEKEKKDDNNR